MTYILLILNTIFGINIANVDNSQDWTIIKSSDFVTITDKNLDSLKGKCVVDKTKHLVYPQQFHSYQELVVDNKIQTFGDKEFKKYSKFIRRVSLSCHEVLSASKLTWRSSSYSPYFNRVLEQPYLSSSLFIKINKYYDLLIFVLLTAGILVALSMYNFKVAATVFLLSVYQYFLVGVNYLGLNLSMLQAHAIADFALWLSLLIILREILDKLKSNKAIIPVTTLSFIPFLLYFFIATSGDEIQASTTYLLLITTLVLVHIYYRLKCLSLLISPFSFGLTLYFICSFNDALLAFGFLSSSFSLICISSLVAIFTLHKSSIID